MARVLAVSARYRSLGGDRTEGLRLGREALAMADELSLDELRAHALITIGTARFFSGDDEGERDLEKALEIALAANSPIASTALNNLGVIASNRDFAREHELVQEAGRVAVRMGDRETERFSRGNVIWTTWALGRWDEALDAAEAFIAECESGSPHYLEPIALGTRAEIRLGRGDVEAALADFARALDLARQARDVQTRFPSLATSVRAHAILGRIDEARLLAREFVSGARELEEPVPALPPLTEFASELGLVDELRELIDRLPPSPFKEVSSADLDGDFERSADIFAGLGFVSGEAERHMRAAERLIPAGRRQEGDMQLHAALEFFRSVGASLYIQRAEKLLPRSA